MLAFSSVLFITFYLDGTGFKFDVQDHEELRSDNVTLLLIPSVKL